MYLYIDRAARKALAQERLLGQHPNRCPCCQTGTMRRVGILPPSRAPPSEDNTLQSVVWLD
ncbi:MAG: hypothetical protein U5L45_22310 [Saprospiraceae bacterium]|nr:hypothetical protein [Saprospiraceae bacterium]